MCACVAVCVCVPDGAPSSISHPMPNETNTILVVIAYKICIKEL